MEGERGGGGDDRARRRSGGAEEQGRCGKDISLSTNRIQEWSVTCTGVAGASALGVWEKC